MKFLVLVLVLVLLLVGVPFFMGADAMGYCPKCASGLMSTAGLCLVILTGLLLVLRLTAMGWVMLASLPAATTLRASPLLRPPR